MDDPLFVSPRESFLLGLAAGEYEAARESDSSVRFASILKKRILPWLPTFGGTNRADSVSLREVPSDTEWIETDGVRSGYSNSRPDCHFVHLPSTEFVFRRRWIPPERRSLLELLIAKLGCFMSLSIREHGEFGGSLSPEQIAKAEHRWFVIFHNDDGDPDTECVGREVPAAIQRSLLELVERNDRSLFEAGRLFGLVVAAIESFQTETNELPDDEARNALRDSLRGPVDSLLGVDWIRRNHFAEQALSELTWCASDKAPSWNDSLQELANRESMNVWVAIGELMGVLKDVDVFAKDQDAASATARAFTRDDSPDQVAQRVKLAERDLSEKQGEGIAAYVISIIKDDIETLSRRVWAIELSSSNDRRLDLPSIWHREITKPTTEYHGRFASIALAMYKSYRNPATHRRDDFVCSCEEARFFVSGVRALVDLCRRIQATGEHGK